MPDTCRSSISILVLMSVCVCAQLAMSAPDKAYSSVKTGNSALIRTIDTSESTFVQDDNSLLLNAAGNSVGKVDMQPWIAYSQRQLKRAWSQPRDPKTLSTVVTFRVDAHGRASKIAVEKPSGSKSFDKSTVEAVRSLNLLHKPPIETVRLRARFVHTVFRVLHAKDREFFLTRGRALIATQQYREAVADLTKSIAAKQWPADSYLARAECFDQLGDSQKAIADYSECIRRDPVAVEPHWH